MAAPSSSESESVLAPSRRAGGGGGGGGAGSRCGLGGGGGGGEGARGGERWRGVGADQIGLLSQAGTAFCLGVDVGFGLAPSAMAAAAAEEEEAVVGFRSRESGEGEGKRAVVSGSGRTGGLDFWTSRCLGVLLLFSSYASSSLFFLLLSVTDLESPLT